MNLAAIFFTLFRLTGETITGSGLRAISQARDGATAALAQNSADLRTRAGQTSLHSWLITS